MKRFIFISTFFFSIIFLQKNIAFAQEKSKKAPSGVLGVEEYKINAIFTEEIIKIDGEMNEEIWQKTDVADNFFQNFPYDTSFALAQTEVKMVYNTQYLYVIAKCYNRNPEIPYISQSLRRDYDGGNNDGFVVFFDPFKDKTNGFAFGITPFGVQREGLVVNGNNPNNDWDNKWFSASKIYEDYYIVEMAIPFKTLRFKDNATSWRVNFGRIDRKNNEFSSWVPIPRNFGLSSIAFAGEVIFDKPLKKAGTNVVVIPYVTGGTSQDFTKNQTLQTTRNAGGDVKIAVTSSLNLDLTFNPDFSQVEVDRQVTNLERFEIFFPERRQFFLENNDLFAQFGFSRIRPFFSRRIGIGRDTTTNQIIQNPILYGLRLSGKVNKDWRVGLLNMQSQRQQEAGIEAQNYTVATFQRQVFSRSNIGGIFVNRQRTSGANANSDFDLSIQDFNRVVGLDYNLASKNNKWSGKFFVHQLLKPKNETDQYAHASYLGYNDLNWDIAWNHEFVGKNYNPDLGFVPRRNHWRLEPFVRYKLYPKKGGGLVNRFNFQFYNNIFWNTEGKLTDRFSEFGHTINFNNSAFAGVWVSNQYTYLFSAFDPTNTGGEKLPEGSEYTTTVISAYFASNVRKKFTYGITTSFGEFFNGRNDNITLNLGYRLQPYALFSLDLNYNQLRFPEPYNSRDLILISPRADITFTRSLFLTAFAQYNKQIDNTNLNVRVQWRFRPVSDIFLVYSDNYYAENFGVKNRSLVLKMTYWLNM